MGRIAPGIDTPRRVAVAATVGIVVEAAMVWRFGWSARLPPFLYLGAVGTVISVNDHLTRRIPTLVIGPSYPIGAALLAAASLPDPRWWLPLAHASIAMVGVAGFYLALALAYPGGLGLGDVWLGGLLGLFLGSLGWADVTTATLAGWSVSLVALGARRVVLHRRDRPRGLPLGPCLCAGALLAILTIRPR